MHELPFLPMIVQVLINVPLPALVFGFFAGGRGIVLGLIALLGVAVVWLVWFLWISGDCCPTGMEGMSLIIVPILFGLAVIVAGVCYALLWLVRLLPDQRRRHRG